jgi:hypothetical protein
MTKLDESLANLLRIPLSLPFKLFLEDVDELEPVAHD